MECVFPDILPHFIPLKNVFFSPFFLRIPQTRHSRHHGVLQEARCFRSSIATRSRSASFVPRTSRANSGLLARCYDHEVWNKRYRPGKKYRKEYTTFHIANRVENNNFRVLNNRNLESYPRVLKIRIFFK